MRYGLIYKYTNKINHKSYIGQTIQKLEKRHKRHLYDSKQDELYFHNALKKYGMDNFSLEIIEDNITFEQLNDREAYWIKYYNTFYLNGEGYNMTEGGQWGNAPRKLSDKSIQEIKELLKNNVYQMKDIAIEYDVSLSCISDINTGRTWFDQDLTYPISPISVKNIIMTEGKYNEIVDLLENTTLSYNEIANKANVYEYTVGSINRGEHSFSKNYCNPFPIRKPVQKHTYKNKITEDQVWSIIKDLIFTNLTNKQIGEKYNVHYNTIGDISNGKSWKNITKNFVCSIKKNKIENKKIYENIMVQSIPLK